MNQHNQNNNEQSADTGLLDQRNQVTRLRFQGGSRDGEVVRIGANDFTIGSAEDATFRLVCPGVHPIHCIVAHDHGGAFIRRLAEDTWLNGEVFEDAPLNVGDKLVVGPLEFEVLDNDELQGVSVSLEELELLKARVEQAEAMMNETQVGVEPTALENELEYTKTALQQKEAELAQLQRELDLARGPITGDPADPTTANEGDFEASTESRAMDMLDRLRAEVQNDAEAGEVSLIEESPLQEAQAFSEEFAAETGDADAASDASYNPPTSAEELSFSAPQEESPVDTAAILAKFGHSMEDDAYEPEPVAAAPEPIAAVYAEPEPEENDNDIQDYMASLMARVGGEAQPSAEAAKAAATPVNVAQPVPAMPQAKVEITPLDPSEFIPRARAPLAADNLRALRAVANSSARSAIDVHEVHSLKRSSQLMRFFAVVSAIVCISMAIFSSSLLSIPSLVSAIALVAGIFTGVKSLTCSGKAERVVKKRTKLKQAQEAAAEV